MIIEKIDSQGKLGLNEFCKICDGFGAFTSSDDLKKVAKPLIELANNDDLLVDFLNEQLADVETYQKNSFYNIQSLILAKRKHYDVRMNFWPSAQEYQLEDKNVSTFFAYEFAHDHNFDFITTGYTPGGYETDIYLYNYQEFEVGDSADLSFHGRFELTKGTVMIYEKSKDIHTQLPPKQFAISINIIPKQFNINTQYGFDLESGTVSSVIQEGSPLFSLRKLLEGIGNQTLIDNFERRVDEFSQY